MTATEELRRLLDERGVEWEALDDFEQTTQWSTHNGAFVYWARERDGKLLVETTAPTKCSASCTPAQAIAATLGRGTCKIHDCEGSFSAVNRPVWRCDCGAFMTQYTDATTYHKPRYCPNCGRKVVGE